MLLLDVVMVFRRNVPRNVFDDDDESYYSPFRHIKGPSSILQALRQSLLQALHSIDWGTV